MRKCCHGNCNQGRSCEVRMPANMGLSDFEREIADEARRDRNIVLAIVAVMVAGYLALAWIGGTGI